MSDQLKGSCYTESIPSVFMPKISTEITLISNYQTMYAYIQTIILILCRHSYCHGRTNIMTYATFVLKERNGARMCQNQRADYGD